jgi:hypothetical protein
MEFFSLLTLENLAHANLRIPKQFLQRVMQIYGNIFDYASVKNDLTALKR